MPRAELLRALGIVIRRRREALGLSQEDLASRAGVHRTYMGSAERGERNVAVVNLERIARALELPLAELFREVAMEMDETDGE